MTAKLDSRQGRQYWRCVCSCGAIKDLPTTLLRRGKVRSCGCLRREVRTTHGTFSGGNRKYPPEYRAWVAMKQRCLNPKTKHYEDYGGRGITVDKKWLNDFAAFYADMGPRPTLTHTLERKDNNENYTPANCRWASRGEQVRNRRSTRMLTHKGENRCLKDWASIIGISYSTLRHRVNNKWPVDDIFERIPYKRYHSKVRKSR